MRFARRSRAREASRFDTTLFVGDDESFTAGAIQRVGGVVGEISTQKHRAISPARMISSTAAIGSAVDADCA